MKQYNRIAEIDFFRGICIILMIIEHFALFTLRFNVSYNQVFVGDFLFPMVDLIEKSLSMPILKYFRYFVLLIFFSLSGICNNFSKNNFRRGWILLFVAISLNLVTLMVSLIIKMDFLIIFGVIHCYSFCILICAVLNKYLKDFSETITYIILIIISIIFCIVKPTSNSTNLFMFIGFPSATYTYTFDYFPIFPYIGIFVFGKMLGKIIYANKTSKIPMLNKNLFKPINFIGRHSIWFYIFQFPILLSVLWLLFYLS